MLPLTVTTEARPLTPPPAPPLAVTLPSTADRLPSAGREPQQAHDNRPVLVMLGNA